MALKKNPFEAKRTSSNRVTPREYERQIASSENKASLSDLEKINTSEEGSRQGASAGNDPISIESEGSTASGYETTLETNPGTTLETNPGTTLETNPGTTLETNPGTTLETNPGTTLETNPGTTLETNPGTDSRKSEYIQMDIASFLRFEKATTKYRVLEFLCHSVSSSNDAVTERMILDDVSIVLGLTKSNLKKALARLVKDEYVRCEKSLSKFSSNGWLVYSVRPDVLTYFRSDEYAEGRKKVRQTAKVKTKTSMKKGGNV
jgi:hypothetical protein